jgi:hypothetical protein
MQSLLFPEELVGILELPADRDFMGFYSTLWASWATEQALPNAFRLWQQ